MDPNPSWGSLCLNSDAPEQTHWFPTAPGPSKEMIPQIYGTLPQTGDWIAFQLSCGFQQWRLRIFRDKAHGLPPSSLPMVLSAGQAPLDWPLLMSGQRPVWETRAVSSGPPVAKILAPLFLWLQFLWLSQNGLRKVHEKVAFSSSWPSVLHLPTVSGIYHGATGICHLPGQSGMSRGQVQGLSAYHIMCSLNYLTIPMRGGLME